MEEEDEEEEEEEDEEDKTDGTVEFWETFFTPTRHPSYMSCKIHWKKCRFSKELYRETNTFLESPKNGILGGAERQTGFGLPKLENVPFQ